MSTNGIMVNGYESNTNYVAYEDAHGQPRIGSLNGSSIQPLAYLSGKELRNLHEVIEIGESQIKASGDKIPLSSVKLLAPIYGRDILCIGKNYKEHAIEFNTSGFDSSDKVDQPTHPVFFTKRATSIIASGEPIFAHEGFTESPDYEGEIGVIIGKSGFRISEADAIDYVWGYTIINDMTARERQRDHKQFYIGKSPDTYCPIGPIAVPASKLPEVLTVETKVNGEVRQKATIQDLIFSVPFLIHTLSEGQTIQPGDVIATGTPAGVGIGKKPPVFLKAGDVVEVSVTGLGTLKNEISGPSVKNQTVARIAAETHVPISNLNKSVGGKGLVKVNGKQLYYKQSGSGQAPIIFIHGLGGSSEFYTPLIDSLGLEHSHSLHLSDLEGHGLSPTSATSVISIASYAEDIAALAAHAKLNSTTVIAHSMGCLIAETLAIKHPELVKNLILLGPPPTPLPEAAQTGSIARAATVRSSGMSSVVDAVATAGTSAASKKDNPVSIAAVRTSLLSQDPEGYAKGCTALAGASVALDAPKIKAKVLIITGDEDKVSPPAVCEKLASQIDGASVKVLSGTGHWHVFENVKGVSEAVKAFL